MDTSKSAPPSHAPYHHRHPSHSYSHAPPHSHSHSHPHSHPYSQSHPHPHSHQHSHSYSHSHSHPYSHSHPHSHPHSHSHSYAPRTHRSRQDLVPSFRPPHEPNSCDELLTIARTMRNQAQYDISRVGGQDHSPLFRATVQLLPAGLRAEGVGRSKIASRRAAATALLEKYPNLAASSSIPHSSASPSAHPRNARASRPPPTNTMEEGELPQDQPLFFEDRTPLFFEDRDPDPLLDSKHVTSVPNPPEPNPSESNPPLSNPPAPNLSVSNPTPPCSTPHGNQSTSSPPSQGLNFRNPRPSVDSPTRINSKPRSPRSPSRPSHSPPADRVASPLKSDRASFPLDSQRPLRSSTLPPPKQSSRPDPRLTAQRAASATSFKSSIGLRSLPDSQAKSLLVHEQKLPMLKPIDPADRNYRIPRRPLLDAHGDMSAPSASQSSPSPSHIRTSNKIQLRSVSVPLKKQLISPPRATAVAPAVNASTPDPVPVSTPASTPANHPAPASTVAKQEPVAVGSPTATVSAVKVVPVIQAAMPLSVAAMPKLVALAAVPASVTAPVPEVVSSSASIKAVALAMPQALSPNKAIISEPPPVNELAEATVASVLGPRSAPPPLSDFVPPRKRAKSLAMKLPIPLRISIFADLHDERAQQAIISLAHSTLYIDLNINLFTTKPSQRYVVLCDRAAAEVTFIDAEPHNASAAVQARLAFAIGSKSQQLWVERAKHMARGYVLSLCPRILILHESTMFRSLQEPGVIDSLTPSDDIVGHVDTLVHDARKEIEGAVKPAVNPGVEDSSRQEPPRIGSVLEANGDGRACNALTVVQGARANGNATTTGGFDDGVASNDASSGVDVVRKAAS